MGRFNPKAFGQPDLLKTIAPGILLRILRPCQEFLTAAGLPLPESEDAEIDYLQLASILANPDERMNSNVVEGLHVITSLGTEDNFDELLDIARRNFVEVDVQATAADLAARIWAEAPEALELKDRAQMVQRRRKFESFRARVPETVLSLDDLPPQLDKLEEDLGGSFQSMKRSAACRVVRSDVEGEARFLIQHGQTCKRTPSLEGTRSTCTFFRPERTDSVVYVPAQNELRINASRLAELRLYRAKFGLHLFGDAEYFVYAEKYTLRPLQQRGQASLFCRDIGGMEAVWLNDIEYAWPGEDHDARHRSNDVFHALAIQSRRIEPGAVIKKAVFSVRMQGETKLRSVLIRPRNIAEYGRGEEAAIIESWLRARGFVVVGAAADDERPGPFLAVA